MPRPFLFLLLAALSLVACDSGDETGLPTRGSLSVTVTTSAGDSSTFSGSAFARYDGDRFQSISLFETDESDLVGNRVVSIAPVGELTLSPRTYSLGGLFDSTADFTAVYSDLSGIGSPSTDSGELSVETVTDMGVRGLFRFDASGRPFDENGPTHYTVRGSFEAVVTRDPDRDR